MEYVSYHPPKSVSFGHSKNALSIQKFDDLTDTFIHNICSMRNYRSITAEVSFLGTKAQRGLWFIQELKNYFNDEGKESVYIKGYDNPSCSCQWQLKKRSIDFFKILNDNKDFFNDVYARISLTDSFSFDIKGNPCIDNHLLNLSPNEKVQFGSTISFTNGTDKYIQPTINLPFSDNNAVVLDVISRINNIGFFKIKPNYLRMIKISPKNKMTMRKFDGKTLSSIIAGLQKT